MRKNKIIEHWSDTKNNFHQNVYWLANPLIQKYFNKMATSGCKNIHWVDYIFDKYFSKTKKGEKILSLGCGKGDLERHISSLNPNIEVKAIDISQVNIDIARQSAAEKGLNNLKYHAADIEKMKFTAGTYDAIFFNSSLHHIFKIDKILKKASISLKDNGYIIINEYVGPNRFNVPEKEKKIIQSVFNLIPSKYKTSLAAENYGELISEVSFFDPDEVKRVDPSEAVNSEAIKTVVYKYFDVLEHNQIGGTILHLLLHNIAGHFQETDEESIKVLNFLCSTEKLLIDLGEISNHFALIIAKKK